MASRQPLEVAARVGEAVGVVDAQPSTSPSAEQREQHRVGRLEDVGSSTRTADQRVDVEEAPVVEVTSAACQWASR